MNTIRFYTRKSSRSGPAFSVGATFLANSRTVKMRRPWDAGGLGCQVRMLGPEPGGTACSTPSVPLLDGQPSLEHARAAFGAQIVKVQRADALRPVGKDASSFPAVTRIVSAWPARHHNCPQLAGLCLHGLASARPECGSDQTFGPVSTAVGRRADLPRAGLDRLVVTRSGHWRRRGLAQGQPLFA